MSVEAPRWRRLEPDERREQILEAAMRLFGERPYSTVSTSEIADAAGVTRGLMHHYFGTKRDLYVEVVRRLVMLPKLDDTAVEAAASFEDRVALCVNWFLDDVLAEHAEIFAAIAGAEGIGDDPEIERILDEADDLAARKVLKTLGVTRPTAAQRAMIRAYGGMLKAAVREWVRQRTLTVEQVRTLLTDVLLTVGRAAVPEELND